MYSFPFDGEALDASVSDAGDPTDGGTIDAGDPTDGGTIDAGSPLCATSGISLGDEVCHKTAVFGTLTRSSPGCFVDVIPHDHETGSLSYDCRGGGAFLSFDGAPSSGQ